MRTELVDKATKSLVINTQTDNTDHELTNLEYHYSKRLWRPCINWYSYQHTYRPCINWYRLTHTDQALTYLVIHIWAMIYWSNYQFTNRPCRPCSGPSGLGCNARFGRLWSFRQGSACSCSPQRRWVSTSWHSTWRNPPSSYRPWQTWFVPGWQ